MSLFFKHISYQLDKIHIQIYKLQDVKGLERKLETYVILLTISRCKYNGVICFSCLNTIVHCIKIAYLYVTSF